MLLPSTNQLMKKLLFSHLDRGQRWPESIRRGKYICVYMKHKAYLFLLVFLVDQGFLETLACLVIPARPVALEPLADLVHQEVLQLFVLRQTGLESGSGLSYILPYDLSGKKKRYHFQVALENLGQLSLNRALASPQGCSLSRFDNMKLCACRWFGEYTENGRNVVCSFISSLWCGVGILHFMSIKNVLCY